MGWCLLHLTVNILAFLRSTVNFFPLRLTDLLKINYHCFKKLKVNFHCCKKFEVLGTFWSTSSFLHCGTLTYTKQIKQDRGYKFTRICESVIMQELKYPWGALGLIFAGYVPLASQNPCPIIAYSVVIF